MLDAAVKALTQILSPPMRTILWRSIGLALVLITVLAIGLQRLLSWFATSGEAWAEAALGPGFHGSLNVLAWILSIAAGLGAHLDAAAPIAALTHRLYAQAVERYGATADQTEIAQPGAGAQHMALVIGKVFGLGHFASDLNHGLGLSAQQGIVRR